MSDCNCEKIGYSYDTTARPPHGYRSGPCAPCSGDAANCCVWHTIEPITCDNCDTGVSGDCPHRTGANTGDYYYYKKTVSLGRISLTDKSGYKHVMSFDGTAEFTTYELFGEINYYTRPNKYCNRQSNDLSENTFAFSESYIGPPFDTKHTGVYEKEPTLIFFVEQRYFAPTDSETINNKSGYFLAVDETDNLVLVGTGASNGEVTTGTDKVNFTGITGSFPKAALNTSSDPDLNSYGAGDAECDAPRPIIKFGSGQTIRSAMSESTRWASYAVNTSCDSPGAFHSDTVWSDTSVYSGFDSYVKSKLTAGARLADLTDVFGADHTINEVTLGGYNISHKVNQGGDIELIYTGDEFSSIDEYNVTGLTGTGAFHVMNKAAISNDVSDYAIAGGQSGFYYIGSKYVHNDWTISMQGCMDLPESKIDPLENITEVYSRGTDYSGFPQFTLSYTGGNTAGYHSGHFEPHLNDAYLEEDGQTLPDSSLCQKIKNLYSGRRLELDSSLTGKMIDLFVRAYKDQYPGDFAGGQTTGDLVQWLTNPSSFYNVNLNDYENSRCCSGTGTITGYNDVSCTNSINGAYSTPFGTGCVETGEKNIYFNGCTGVIRATVSGNLYYDDTSAKFADLTGHRWNYNVEIFDNLGGSLGKISGTTHETGSGLLENDSAWIKATTGDNYTGVFGYEIFVPVGETTPSGFYHISCPDKHCLENCYNLDNVSYLCDTGSNSGYNNVDGEISELNNPPANWGSGGMTYILNMFGLGNNKSSGCCGCQPTGELNKCQDFQGTGYIDYSWSFSLDWTGEYDWDLATNSRNVYEIGHPNIGTVVGTFTTTQDSPNLWISGFSGTNPPEYASGWEYHSGDRMPIGISTYGYGAPEFISGRWQSGNFDISGVNWTGLRHDIRISNYSPNPCYSHLTGDEEKITGTFTFKNNHESGLPIKVTPTGGGLLGTVPPDIATQGERIIQPLQSYTYSSTGNNSFSFIVEQHVSGLYETGEQALPSTIGNPTGPYRDGYHPERGVRTLSHINAGVDFSGVTSFYLIEESNALLGIISGAERYGQSPTFASGLNVGTVPHPNLVEHFQGTDHIIYDPICQRWIMKGILESYIDGKRLVSAGVSECFSGDAEKWAMGTGVTGITGRWYDGLSGRYYRPAFLRTEFSGANLDQISLPNIEVESGGVLFLTAITGGGSPVVADNPMCTDYNLT